MTPWTSSKLLNETSGGLGRGGNILCLGKMSIVESKNWSVVDCLPRWSPTTPLTLYSHAIPQRDGVYFTEMFVIAIIYYS